MYCTTVFWQALIGIILCAKLKGYARENTLGYETMVQRKILDTTKIRGHKYHETVL